MQPKYAFYFADLLIIFLILAFNIVIFTLALRKLTCGRNKDSNRKEGAITHAIRAIAMCAILGLTWVFGFLTIVENRESNLTFQVLFCIFNSLQGMFIFVLFCARQEEARNIWKDWLAGKFEKYGRFYSTSNYQDGHSRVTDMANTQSAAAGNAVVAYNPPEDVVISKSQEKTSSGQVKIMNGQEKTA